MPINQVNVAKAASLVGAVHTLAIIKMAKRQDKLEASWMAETAKVHKGIVKDILESLQKTGKANFPSKIIERHLLALYFGVLGEAANSADIETKAIDKRLAKPPIPKSLRELKELYDLYRKTGRLPKGLKDMAQKIKEQYLKKTQSVWKKYSEDFRSGTEATQADVLRKVEKAADTVRSRAQTIVRTESTNFYNETRKEIYDQSDAITHYLFLAIRDQATTKWCSDKVIQGKRGRHGLVYSKDDPLTAKETPACHWNCRSEMVPLTPFNPRHKRLIEDYSKHRHQNNCHPLPKGWR